MKAHAGTDRQRQVKPEVMGPLATPPESKAMAVYTGGTNRLSASTYTIAVIGRADNSASQIFGQSSFKPFHPLSCILLMISYHKQWKMAMDKP